MSVFCYAILNFNDEEYFIQVLHDLDGQQTEFDETLWGGLIEKMVIQKDGTATVVFKGGIEISVE